MLDQSVILFGLEETYGTDPVPTATAALRVYNMKLTPFAGSLGNRDRDGTGSGAFAETHAGTYQTLTFDFDVSGGGAAGTDPLWGPIAQVCNLSKTVVVSTSVAYATQDFVDDTAKSATVYYYWGGVLHKLTGARGELGVNFTAGGIPYFSASLIGIRNQVTDAAFPDAEATAASWIEGAEMNPDNTTFSLFAVTPELQSASFNLGNQVKFTPRANAQQVRIPGRREGAGKLNFAMPAVATKNWLGIAAANTLGPMQLVHGKTAGNIVQFDGGKLQLLQPSIATQDGELFVDTSVKVCRNPGGTEFKITVK
jgi:hypothetical protein